MTSLAAIALTTGAPFARPVRAEIVGFKRFQADESTWAVRYVGNASMGKLKMRKALLSKTAKLARKEG